jgi:hypothetical protein
LFERALFLLQIATRRGALISLDAERAAGSATVNGLRLYSLRKALSVKDTGFSPYG